MLLVSLEVLHYVFLLAQLCVEELGVRLEFVRQSLLWLVQELGLVCDSLQESIVNFGLDVIVMVLSLVLTVVIEYGFDVILHLALFLVEVHDNVVVLLLLFGVDSLDFLALLSQLSELLNLWSQVGLDVFEFLLNLADSLCDLLQSLILLVVQDLFLIGHSLDLIFDIGVS